MRGRAACSPHLPQVMPGSRRLAEEPCGRRIWYRQRHLGGSPEPGLGKKQGVAGETDGPEALGTSWVGSPVLCEPHPSALRPGPVPPGELGRWGNSRGQSLTGLGRGLKGAGQPEGLSQHGPRGRAHIELST